MLLVSTPIALTAIMSSLNKNIDSFTVVRSLKQFMSEDEALAQYGILGGKVDMLTSLPLSINVAFSTALVPAISAAKARKRQKNNNRKNIIFFVNINANRTTMHSRNVHICRTNIKFTVPKCKCRRSNITNKRTNNNIYNIRPNNKWGITRIWKINDTNNSIWMPEYLQNWC